MVRLVISHAADADLNAIWEYIGLENGNVEAANRILESVRDTLLLLPRFPHLGKRCEEFKDIEPHLMTVVVEGYTIYYRMVDERIEIGRIVHARRERESIVMSWYKSGEA